MSIDTRDHPNYVSDSVEPIPEVFAQSLPPASTRGRRDPQAPTMVLIVFSALATALWSTASPAGIAFADVIYRATFSAVVVWSASRSKRWTLALLAGVSVAVAASLWTQLFAVAGLFIACSSLRKRRLASISGAIIASVSLPALLTQGVGPLSRLSGGVIEDPLSTSALVTTMAILPTVRSAWKTLSRRKRQYIKARARWIAHSVAGVLVVTVAVCATAVPSILSGTDALQLAADSARAGHLEPAGKHFEAAGDDWRRANGILSGPWMTPSRLIPLVGQHVRAAQVSSGQMSALGASAATTTSRVNPDQLIVDGVVNLAQIDDVTTAVDTFAGTIDRASERIRMTRSPWLLPPVASRIDHGLATLLPASDAVSATSAGLQVAADLFGGSGSTNTLLMFSTPAEARGAGGFVGNWTLLRSQDGELEIVDQYRTRELNALLEQRRAVLRADADYTSRYGHFAVERHIQDVTLSPDFPSVAPVAADLFTQATGTRIDAVISVDPYVVEELLRFSGPLDRPDGTVLNSSNASRELLVEQYERYGDDRSGREAELRSLTTLVVAELLESPPNPLTFATRLAPLAAQDRFSLWLADDHHGSLAAELGVDGGFPQTDGDLFALVHQNAGQNKIDTFLERHLAITTLIDNADSTVHHDVTVTLRNTAPSKGLHRAIIGSNGQGLATGTNRMLLSMYTAVPITRASHGGQELPLQLEVEFGRPVYSTVLAIPPGDVATIQLELAGPIDLSEGYNITLAAQPTVHPDQVSWNISATAGRTIIPPSDWETNGDGARWESVVEQDRILSFAIED